MLSGLQCQPNKPFPEGHYPSKLETIYPEGTNFQKVRCFELASLAQLSPRIAATMMAPTQGRDIAFPAILTDAVLEAEATPSGGAPAASLWSDVRGKACVVNSSTGSMTRREASQRRNGV